MPDGTDGIDGGTDGTGIHGAPGPGHKPCLVSCRCHEVLVFPGADHRLAMPSEMRTPALPESIVFFLLSTAHAARFWVTDSEMAEACTWWSLCSIVLSVRGTVFSRKSNHIYKLSWYDLNPWWFLVLDTLVGQGQRNEAYIWRGAALTRNIRHHWLWGTILRSANPLM